MISYLSFLLVPSWSSNMPLYPQNATSQGVCSNSLLFCCFHFRLTFESIKELGGASYSLIMFFQYHDLPKNIIFDHGL